MTTSTTIHLSQVVGALSYALDITEGQRVDHSRAAAGLACMWDAAGLGAAVAAAFLFFLPRNWLLRKTYPRPQYLPHTPPIPAAHAVLTRHRAGKWVDRGRLVQAGETRQLRLRYSVPGPNLPKTPIV